MGKTVFDEQADHYDAWFDSERGADLFAAEVACLEHLMPEDRAGWSEVGVGSGRFAQALGVPRGVDPSRPLLEMARARGIDTVEGVAERLPYADASLGGILLVVTLCFLDDPGAAVREFARVLRPGGRLLAGFVPSESAWGRAYARKGAEGHAFYSVARFYTAEQVTDLAAAEGFCLAGATSTLPRGPEHPAATWPVAEGIRPGWGFVAMLFERQAGRPV